MRHEARIWAGDFGEVFTHAESARLAANYPDAKYGRVAVEAFSADALLIDDGLLIEERGMVGAA